MTDDDARIRGLEDDFEADMAARYEGAGDPGIHVTSIVDAAYSDLYDEIMLKHPAERSIAEEAFIEHVAERLVAEVADEDVFINDEGVIPRCDICGNPQLRVGDDWNGETGNHVSCEDRIKARLEYLRGEIDEERISYSELAELQGLADHIDRSDVVLLQWAGVPEFEDED